MLLDRISCPVGLHSLEAPAGAGPHLPPPALALQFRRYRLAHAWHAHHEDSVIFK